MAHAFDLLGYHTLKENHVGVDMDAMVSLPFYCQLGGISVQEIDFEKYMVRVKP